MDKEELKKFLKYCIVDALENFENSSNLSAMEHEIFDLPIETPFRENIITVKQDIKTYKEALSTLKYPYDDLKIDYQLFKDGMPDYSEYNLPDNADYYSVARDYTKAKLLYFMVLKERLKGNYHSKYESALSKYDSAKKTPNDIDSCVTIEKAFKEFIENKAITLDNNAIQEIKKSFDIFLFLFPAKNDTNTIKNKELSKISLLLSKIPKNRTKIKAYRDKNIRELLEMEIEDDNLLLSITTINKYIGWFNQFIDFLNRNEYCSGLFPIKTIKKNTVANEEKLPYDENDLAKWVTVPMYKASKFNDTFKKEAHTLWIPLISLYTGMGLQEIGQLEVQDVTESNGVNCFNITLDGDTIKKLKRKARQRLIPIHSKLKEAGIIEYTNKLKKHGIIKLFPNIKLDSKGGFNGIIGKKLNRMSKKYVSVNKKKTLYSFRHTFTNALKQAMVERDLADEITGHYNDNITFGRYSNNYEAQIRASAVEKVIYNVKGLDDLLLQFKDAVENMS